MFPQCLPQSFSSIQLTIWEQMSFQDFQDGHHGGHPGYWNETNLAIFNLQVTQCLQTSFGSIRLTIREQTWFEDFQDGHCGSHLRYQKGMILAILNLYDAPMPPIVSTQSDLRFGRRCDLKNFNMTAILEIGTE